MMMHAELPSARVHACAIESDASRACTWDNRFYIAPTSNNSCRGSIIIMFMCFFTPTLIHLGASVSPNNVMWTADNVSPTHSRVTVTWEHTTQPLVTYNYTVLNSFKPMSATLPVQDNVVSFDWPYNIEYSLSVVANDGCIGSAASEPVIVLIELGKCMQVQEI